MFVVTNTKKYQSFFSMFQFVLPLKKIHDIFYVHVYLMLSN